MLSTAAQGHFAAEFATFLVAAAGLALVALRPELLSRSRSGRAALVLGFGAVGTVAFLQGSLLVTDQASPATGAVQGVALVLVALGSLSWCGGETGRRLLWGGLVLAVSALALDLSRHAVSADVVLGAGAVLIGAALLTASRRSVAARVAASGAGTLLVLVLVLSVVLSTELTRNIQTNVNRRVNLEAAAVTSLVSTAGQTNALVVARSASLVLSSSVQAASALQGLAAAPNPSPSPTLSTILGYLRDSLVQQDSLLYLDPRNGGRVLALSTTSNIDQATVAGTIGSAPVRQAVAAGITKDSERGSVEVVGDTAVAIGVEPVAVQDPTTHLLDFPGVLVALQPLDNAYLAVSAKFDPVGTLGVALVSRHSVLAQAGPRADSRALLALGASAIDTSAATLGRAVGPRLYSVQPVITTDNRTVMALVTSAPTSDVTKARDLLFRELFEIALGGTLIALLLAALVGERIGAGLRTLTEAAQRIQRGDFTEPSGVRTDDEVGVLATAFDSMAVAISDQTAALQEAAEEETALRNQMEAIVAGMSEALVAIDADGLVTLVNRAAEELLEVDAPTAVGQLVDDVIVAAADDGSDLIGRLRRPSPSQWSALATLVPDIGPGIPVAISSGALRGPAGNVAGAVLVLRDLRPERQVERMKSEFLSRIGHELRTPLTAILGYADILLHRRVAESKSRQFHQEIFEAGKRLSRVIEMLEFSAAAQAGRSLLRPEVTSVRSVVDEVVADWQGRLNGNHAVTRRVARRLPDIVADRRWLALSLNELVDNAVKFSPDGGKVGVIAAAASLGDRTAVEISVVDQGLGMSEADQALAFSEFVQGDTSDTRRFGGLGLGLSLVKRVAEAHGGTVTVESTPQKGSKFSIVLPV